MSAKQHIKPLGDRVLVKLSEIKVSKGGILLPETVQEKIRQGEVVTVGPGKPDDKGNLKSLEICAGDTVLFSSYAGTEVKTDDDQANFLIVSESDILGVLV
jgi:chaperonin GroES